MDANKLKTIQCSKDLPATKKREEFLAAYERSQIMILTGDTGSGKTTQVPQFVLYKELPKGKMVVCTQPRRLAATSVAGRVASEMHVTLGEEVGYGVRFDDKSSEKTMLKYVTDGLLLAEVLGDRKMAKYSCVIIDEAHERTLATDVLMALLKVVVKGRPDLKVIIMSATLDAAKFQQYFAAPIFTIPGRTFPVRIRYLQEATPNYFDTALRTVMYIHNNLCKGDILVFLAGEDEIQRACVMLGKQDPLLDPLPLYSALEANEQRRVFAPAAFGRRKCIFATNIAETSLTIDGVVYVVDTGLAKASVYNPRARAEMLQTMRISRASAAQRTGRAGRTRNGYCFRLYTTDAFSTMMRPSAPPAILCEEMKSVILQMLHTGHKDLFALQFIDNPPREYILRAVTELKDLGFINDDVSLTPQGKLSVRFPLDPVWFYAIQAAQEYRSVPAIVTIAAAASTQQSIFLRPHAVQHVAHMVMRVFGHPLSDHVTIINAIHAYIRAKIEGKIDMALWCRSFFINQRAMEEVLTIRRHVVETLVKKYGKDFVTGTPFGDFPDVNIRKSLAMGLFHQTAIKHKGEDVYRTIHQNQDALLHPESGLIKAGHEWVVYNSFVLSSKQYLHVVTAVEPEWLVDHPYFQTERMSKKTNGRDLVQDFVKQSLDKARQRLGQ
ncbi:hypothetical protein DL765_009121 [Monosporascus sp. GIB2]|nr:hypothetical protein DL765_009121 [Monosporascus sp. GIB2]